MKIDRHISELLYEHDCVIVPDLGGFVGNYSPAKVDKVQNKFTPPSKEISFNPQLTRNDGLLANHIADGEQVSYDKANERITESVVQWRHLLDSGKRVEIDEVGMLYKDTNTKLQFEPDHTVNHLLDAFGMSILHAQPIKREPKKKPLQQEPLKAKKKVEPIIKESKTAVEKEPIPIKRKSTFRKALPYAAAAVPFVAYLVWLTTNTDVLKQNGNFHYSDLNPFSEKVCAQFEPRQQSVTVWQPEEVKPELAWMDMPDTVHYIDHSFIDTDPKTSVTIQLSQPTHTATPESTYVSTSPTKGGGSYHVIGGCFQYFENAEKLVAKLRGEGFDAQILDKRKGLHRVAVQSYTTRNEAVQALASIKGTQSDAWLLKK